MEFLWLSLQSAQMVAMHAEIMAMSMRYNVLIGELERIPKSVKRFSGKMRVKTDS